MSNQNEEKKLIDAVPYIVYEGTVSRHERTVKRLIRALVITICLLVASNFVWIYYISQYDFESYEYTQDGEGVNLVGNGNGVEYNGSATEDTQASNKEETERQGESHEET